MEEVQALAIIAQVIKDRKQWGESAGIRVAQFELVNALLALQERFSGEYVPKAELTLSNRRYAALNAQHEKLKKDWDRVQRDRNPST